jgi:hypothetical protein
MPPESLPTWVVYSLAGTKMVVQGAIELEGTRVIIYTPGDGFAPRRNEFVGLLDNMEFIVRDDDGEVE